MHNRRMKKRALPIMSVLLLSACLLSACAGMFPGTPPAPYPADDAPLTLRATNFAALPGWELDDLQGSLAALARSCAKLKAQDQSKAFGDAAWNIKVGDWAPACSRIESGEAAQNPRAFYQQYFTPYEATSGSYREGLFTGYYEASLRGARVKTPPYNTPLLARPDDLVMVELGDFRESLKGQRIAGRVVKGALKPYESRAEIEAGKLANATPLVYVDDPVDAFFLHIQGSGRVLLDDGSEMRVGYAGQNGHVYYAIGRELVKRGYMDKDAVSMQAIRVWLSAHPDQAAELMNLNPSYVFFEELKGEGPLGAQNVALTPMRSLAVDRTKIPYSTPLWLSIKEPVAGQGDLQRLVIAQDTGGAIKGPLRGDFYWGYGEEAAHKAGLMKAPGRYWLLLPRARLD